MIYLDHNATTPILEEAKNAMIEILQRPLNASAVHFFGREGKKIVEHARKRIFKSVGVVNIRDYQLIFTSSGTEANNLLFSNFKDADIFISATEHVSILGHLHFASNIHTIAVDKNGILDKQDLIQKLTNSSASKKLVSVIFANNETGVIQDIKEITDIAHSFGAIMHSDSVQAFGKIELDMVFFDVDFITISAHKIGGGVGAAALIGKTKYHLQPHIIGGGQERGVRSGTENIAAISSFGKASEIATSNIKTNYQKLQNLQRYFEHNLKETFPTIKIVGELVDRLPNTSLIISDDKNKKAETQIIALDLNGIAVSSGAACSSGKIGVSATLAAMGFNDDEKASAIRISTGFSNSKEDIDYFLKIYKQINSELNN